MRANHLVLFGESSNGMAASQACGLSIVQWTKGPFKPENTIDGQYAFYRAVCGDLRHWMRVIVNDDETLNKSEEKHNV